MHPLPEISAPRPDETPQLVATLAAAFADDPALAWILPDRDDRLHRLPRLFSLIAAEDLASGLALRSAGSQAVSLWLDSADAGSGLFDTLRHLPGYWWALGGGLLRGLRVSQAIEAHHPRDTAFDYLHFIGVAPAAQGQGLGGALIRAGQARASARGRPIYLETATPENVGLYQRLGFSILAEWHPAPAAPRFWSMWWEG